MAARVVDVELTAAPGDVALDPHDQAFVLVRVHGHPMGVVRIACGDRVLTSARLRDAVASDRVLSTRIARRLALDAIMPAEPSVASPPSWTVAVCTRDRPAQLARCLKSVLDLDVVPPQVLVVDNAPSNDDARSVARELGVAYVREDVVGLNRARQRALAVATGDVVLFTDDDVVVDRAWSRAMLEPFAHPRVGAVTGLVLPLELETRAQEEFEARGGFGRGFERKCHDIHSLRPVRAGSMGAGASMAFRRDVAVELGVFDAELDGGTLARSGGDTYALFLALRAGWQVVYTPDALGWHEHRRDHAALRSTLQGYSTGGYTWLLKALLEQHQLDAVREMVMWFRKHHLKRLRWALSGRDDAPDLDLALAELWGVLAAPRAYAASRRRRR